MERSQRSQQIESLKQQGFKVVKGDKQLYVNSRGEVYNLNTGRYMKPRSDNKIKSETGYWNIDKLVLEAFGGEPYRSGHIIHKDGNKANREISNLKYNCVFPPDVEPEPLNNEDILKAIRCYSPVKKRFTAKDNFRMKLHLATITDIRLFFIENSELQYIEVFKTYLSVSTKEKVMKAHDLTTRDYSIIVNRFLNMLVRDVLNDLEKGVLSVMEYQPRKRSLPIIKESDSKKVEKYRAKLNEAKK